MEKSETILTEQSHHDFLIKRLENLTIDVEVNPILISSVIRKELANLRQSTKAIKLRSDVNYSKKKLRAQKANSVSRMSNRSSPILRGGGSVNQVRTNFKCKINSKEMLKAKLMLLKDLYSRGMIFVQSGAWPAKTSVANNLVLAFKEEYQIPQKSKILLLRAEKINSVRNLQILRDFYFKDINPLRLKKSDVIIINVHCLDELIAI